MLGRGRKRQNYGQTQGGDNRVCQIGARPSEDKVEFVPRSVGGERRVEPQAECGSS